MAPSDSSPREMSSDAGEFAAWPDRYRLESIENPEDGTITVVEAEKADTAEATTHWLTIDDEFVIDRESMV